MRLAVFLLFFLIATAAWSQSGSWSGHVKAQPALTTFSDNSVYNSFTESPLLDRNAALRLNTDYAYNAWHLELNYQLYGLAGDSLALAQLSQALLPGQSIIPSDDHRLWNLSADIETNERRYIGHRLDRLSFTYTGEKSVVRVGRQAISWGNGFIFNPMDIVNPFDPTTVDTEYKTGDDMVYAQYLLDSGADTQFVAVPRRNRAGDVDESVSSVAGKYHTFIGSHEIDVLVAQHYNDTVVALGGVWSLGGAIARADIVTADSAGHQITSAVANLSYSWLWWQRNISGTLEYYRNGAGIASGDYSAANLAQQPELLERLYRGEVYNLARDYLGASVTIEMHPLWLLTPNLFYNLNDYSAMTQIVSSHDLAESWQLFVALQIPVGGRGTEFGGIESGVEGLYLELGKSINAQLAWYF